MGNLTKRERPDRSKINMHEAWELDHWTRELGVSRSELQRLVDKVGNSAAEVRKRISPKQEMMDKNCSIRFGIGFVCENHLHRAWSEMTGFIFGVG